MKGKLNILFFSVCFFAFAGCANRVTPTGGPKDVTPPEVLNARPENKSVNFTGSTIEITFDEYVQFKELKKQLVISPPVEPEPSVTIRKKSVVVEFKQPLRSNTTYTINFGNAIVDVHEDNPIPGYRYIFSTGIEIDSLEITGTVLNAQTQKPEENVVVLLYEANTPDSLLMNSMPAYYTRAGSNGNYTLKNLRDGEYRLFALADANNNYRNEDDSELVGFIPGKVKPGTGLTYDIALFKQQSRRLAVKEYTQPVPGKFLTVFSRSVENPSWHTENLDTSKVLLYASETKDTVIIYTSEQPETEIKMVWFENGSVIDTVTYQPPRKQALPSGKKELFAGYKTRPAQGGVLQFGQNPAIVWDVPLSNTDTSLIKVFSDSVQVDYSVSFSDSLHTILEIKPARSGLNNEIKMDYGAVTDLHGKKNDSLSFSYIIPDERTMGSITFIFSNPLTNTKILQLVNDKDDLIRQVSGAQMLKGSFEMLTPGTYFLRLVDDVNLNGRWDPGDFRKDILPEKVEYKPGSIVVRANWEVEVEWDTVNVNEILE